MTRARILADYVSSGDELALKAPIAGPTFTGTVAIPNVANLETAVVANTAKVTNATHTGDVTGGTALTIATDAVDIAMLSATGTASATTFLRGDNAWAAAGAASVGYILGVAMLADVYDGAGGASYTSHASTIRRLNTVAYEIGMSVTLGSNEWTFDEAGSYLINAHGPATESYRHILRLYSDTGSTLVATGSAEFTEVGQGQHTHSFVYGKAVISDAQKTGGGSEKSYGLYHIVDSARATHGLGQYSDDTTVEQHTQVQIFKIQE